MNVYCTNCNNLVGFWEGAWCKYSFCPQCKQSTEVVNMGGGFNPVESIENIVNRMEPKPLKHKWYYVIEETAHWEKFCYKQEAERRREMMSTQKLQRATLYRYAHQFVLAIQRYRQIRKAFEMEPRICSWRAEADKAHDDYFKVFTAYCKLQEENKALGATLDMKGELTYCFKTKQNDAFLSKRVVERYQELNDLHQTNYVLFEGLRSCYNTRLFISARTELNRLLFVGGPLDRRETHFKWRRILESWNHSSGSVSESKSDIKNSTNSAPPTHVNECGI